MRYSSYCAARLGAKLARFFTALALGRAHQLVHIGCLPPVLRIGSPVEIGPGSPSLDRKHAVHTFLAAV